MTTHVRRSVIAINLVLAATTAVIALINLRGTRLGLGAIPVCLILLSTSGVGGACLNKARHTAMPWQGWLSPQEAMIMTGFWLVALGQVLLLKFQGDQGLLYWIVFCVAVGISVMLATNVGENLPRLPIISRPRRSKLSTEGRKP
jgi:hypothetical protein